MEQERREHTEKDLIEKWGKGFSFTLNNPLSEEDWDYINDVDFDRTDEITFHTKHGKEVTFIKKSAQPEIIQCREYKFASGDSRICMKFGHSPIGELDFCAWAERKQNDRHNRTSGGD